MPLSLSINVMLKNTTTEHLNTCFCLKTVDVTKKGQLIVDVMMSRRERHVFVRHGIDQHNSATVSILNLNFEPNYNVIRYHHIIGVLRPVKIATCLFVHMTRYTK